MPDSHRGLPLAAGALLLLALIALPGASLGEQNDCPPAPPTLSGKGGAGGRFTMLIRVNKPSNVGDYAALQSRYGQLRPRDVFVINTRYKGASPRQEDQIVSALHGSFPCNRIIALNGLGSDPQRPGYAFSLIDSPRPWAVLLDWERLDWARARATNHHMSRWKQRFGRNVNRLNNWIGRVARGATEAGGEVRKIGAIPAFFHDWQYGRIARVLDRRNRRFGHRHGGVQVVGTQASCMKRRGTTKGMRTTAKQVVRQYGRAGRNKRNLALEIAFSDHGRSKRHLPIRSVNEGRAGSCLRAALAGGAGAILFWASPDSIRALAQTHHFRRLRHRH